MRTLRRAHLAARIACVAAMAISVAAPLSAAQDQPPIVDGPHELYSYISTVNTVSWNLKQQAARICGQTAFSFGIAIDNRKSYKVSLWPLLASTVGLGELPQIVSVAPLSPGSRAGLKPGDVIVSVNGEGIEELEKVTQNLTRQGDAILGQLDQTSTARTLQLEVRRNGRLQSATITSEQVCAGRAILETVNGFDVKSDGLNIAIGTGTMKMVKNDDEVALLLGHEYAHIIYRHKEVHRLLEVRRQESEADLLGLALAKCAGYNPELGLQFWARFRARPLGWLMTDPSHGSVKWRIAQMQAALPSIRCPLSLMNVTPPPPPGKI